MNKHEFFGLLFRRLNKLPQSEIQKTVDYYNEIICDRMEDGMTEEEAVAALGNIDEIISNVMYEQPIQNLIKASVTGTEDKKHMNIGWLILLIVGSPIWLSLTLAFLSVMLAVYIVVWTMVFVVYVTSASFAIAGVTSVIGGLIFFAFYPAPTAICTIGIGFVCAALAIFIGISCKYVTKGAVKFTSMGIHAIKTIVISLT